ncbi:MAG: DUF4440 domain-containing protein [Pseudomonadales bacterium]|nr:DUF4440 domain-containing protein [Pseudomonadales bacterium]
MTAAILERLVSLETELHLNSTRNNPSRLLELLHADFIEIGRSGKRYTRDDILLELEGEAELPEIHSSAFELQQLGNSFYLLTYVSAHHGSELHRFTRRASLWINKNGSWVLRYHQGTALSD